jgi:hypothetical protein
MKKIFYFLLLTTFISCTSKTPASNENTGIHQDNTLEVPKETRMGVQFYNADGSWSDQNDYVGPITADRTGKNDIGFYPTLFQCKAILANAVDTEGNQTPVHIKIEIKDSTNSQTVYDKDLTTPDKYGNCSQTPTDQPGGVFHYDNFTSPLSIQATLTEPDNIDENTGKPVTAIVDGPTVKF